MKINSLHLVLITFLICYSSCLTKNQLKINNTSLKLVIDDCHIIDTNRVELILKLTNILSKDSIVITVDPWIKESWNTNGTNIQVFVDPVCRYPFIQLGDSLVSGTADVYREYPFSVFKNFIIIPPQSNIFCRLQFMLKEDYLKKVDFKLPILVEIPFTDMKNFFIYRLEDQILSEKKELYIGLVDPEYYPYSTNGENEYKIKFDEVFKLQTGYSGSIPILKK